MRHDYISRHAISDSKLISINKITGDNFPSLGFELFEVKRRLNQEGDLDCRKLSEAARIEIENERSMFARDIHDEICGKLSGTLIQLSNLKKKLEYKGDQESINDLDKIVAHSYETLDSSRRISNGIRPSLLDKFGIEVAIEQLLQDFSCNYGIKTEMSIHAGEFDRVFSEQQKIEIYRISHEVMNNVIKHSHATIVSCEITRNGRFVTFIFADNGNGIPLDISDGSGIPGMMDRAISAKGVLKVYSTIPSGTLIKLTIESSSDES